MHLKSLTLKGFKSFASATTMTFEPGICAVVGPNGSGKSNVVDALAWVMGEQGAKTLRGGKMQDVIFAGAGGRRPLGRAEVTLTIDNHDGVLPIDYAEVSITRRMFRDGGSEYEINGSRARLMDVQELLSDSGIGREMHIIVGQGKLAEILESRPEDRRAFIEEAAGVLKHRRRKEKAQRKLVGMQANLDRLQDLTGELAKQLTPLARQAEAAQRAATVQAELREAKHNLAAARVLELQEAVRRAEEDAQTVTAREKELGQELEEQEEALQAREEHLAELGPQVDEAQERHFSLSTLLERSEATIRIARDRAADGAVDDHYSGPDPDALRAQARRTEEELAQSREACDIARERLETLSDSVEEHEEELRAAEAEHMAQVRAIADRREGVVRLLAAEESQAKEVESLRAEVTQQEENAQFARRELEESEEELRVAKDSLAGYEEEREPLADAQERAAAEREAAEARLRDIRAQHTDFERTMYGLRSRIDTLRSTLPADDAHAIGENLRIDLSPLAEGLDVTPGAERAVAAALGQHAEAQVSSAWAVAVEAFQREDVARLTLLREDADDTASPWRMDADLPQGTQWLLDAFSARPGVARVLNRLVADVVLCPDAQVAMAVVEGDPRLRAVTPEGILVGEGWAQVGRGATSTVEVSGQIDAAERELAEVEARHRELSGTVAGAEQAAEEARVALAQATAELRDADARRGEHERLVERAEKEVRRRREQAERLAEQRAQRAAALAEAERRWEETRDRVARVEEPGSIEEPSTEARDEAQAMLAQVRAMELEARMNLRQHEEKVTQLEQRGERLRRQAEQETQARQRFEARMAQRRHRVAIATTVARLAEELQEKIQSAVEEATRVRDEHTEAQRLARARAATLKQQVSALRQQHSRQRDRAHEAEMALNQAAVRLDEVMAKTVEQLGIPVAELLENYHPGEGFDVAAEKKRLKQAEKDLRALGKVNPLALEEYKALEERHRYLATQLEDVIQARRALEEVIEEVDERILQLFTEAWEDVERHFPQVFSTLFPGGEGRLLLTDPSDMLGTGIEVEARPPGKKVKRLSLLSGGEKSLTALAMLVAIFKARPSPFYVLDEVEAALDDVNLRRLIALLEELRADSQLIVITHQKPTMDVANVLYGVTMRDDGVTRVLSQRMAPHRKE
ncbi:chromosome segregation protein SMC [Corynebacterium uropygiale]|uniref:Chromosome partition protein Smc n=1 Tax=Corynebacterium uropygiale TaxID=1775911 RepID=A0A9X1U0D2_9CORY|nr:chromosome segregation protein SMC [Corynebacterium uropygiale]